MSYKERYQKALREVDEIHPEDLKAASDMFERLLAGTFYEEEAAAVQWLKDRGRENERSVGKV